MLVAPLALLLPSGRGERRGRRGCGTLGGGGGEEGGGEAGGEVGEVECRGVVVGGGGLLAGFPLFAPGCCLRGEAEGVLLAFELCGGFEAGWGVSV